MKVSIYIKCNFRGNPKGAGEAAAIIEFIGESGNTYNRKHYITVCNDTKNSLLLKACTHTLRTLVKPCEVNISMECGYIDNVLKQGLLRKWQKVGWVKANGKQPANLEEWKQFYMLTMIHNVEIMGTDSKYNDDLEKILNQRKAEGNYADRN